MRTYKFNINASVKVKLTDFGREILADQHNKYFGVRPKWEKRRPEYYISTEDSNGYTKFQMWDLMKTFGKFTGMCKKSPFDREILIDESNLESFQITNKVAE